MHLMGPGASVGTQEKIKPAALVFQPIVFGYMRLCLRGCAHIGSPSTRFQILAADRSRPVGVKSLFRLELKAKVKDR